MKYCPTCRSTYTDETLQFCLQDGSLLATVTNPNTELPTTSWNEPRTEPYISQNSAPQATRKSSAFRIILMLFSALMILGLGIVGTLFVVKYANSNIPGNPREPANKASVVNQSTPTPKTNANANSPTPTATPTSTPTPDKAQLKKLVDQHIKDALKKEDLEETEKERNRQTVYGDLDGDDDDDAAVLYVWNFIGGNGWGISLAVFKNNEGTFEYAADEAIGGKSNRGAKLQNIKNKKIYLSTTEYSSDDADCCPSIKGSAVYMLNGTKLVEGKKSE